MSDVHPYVWEVDTHDGRRFSQLGGGPVPESIRNAQVIRLMPEDVDRSFINCHKPVHLFIPPNARPTYFRRILKDSNGETHGIVYCIGYLWPNTRTLRAVDPATGGVYCIEEELVGKGQWKVVSYQKAGK